MGIVYRKENIFYRVLNQRLLQPRLKYGNTTFSEALRILIVAGLQLRVLKLIYLDLKSDKRKRKISFLKPPKLTFGLGATLHLKMMSILSVIDS